MKRPARGTASAVFKAPINAPVSANRPAGSSFWWQVGNHYGTLRAEVLGHLANGTDVVMDIDVQGAAQVRACEDPAIVRARVDLFVMPPSEHELHARLAGRGTDSEETIALRMKNAMEEMRHWPTYTYRLLSSTREEDYLRFKALLVAERLRVSRLG